MQRVVGVDRQVASRAENVARRPLLGEGLGQRQVDPFALFERHQPRSTDPLFRLGEVGVRPILGVDHDAAVAEPRFLGRAIRADVDFDQHVRERRLDFLRQRRAVSLRPSFAEVAALHVDDRLVRAAMVGVADPFVHIGRQVQHVVRSPEQSDVVARVAVVLLGAVQDRFPLLPLLVTRFGVQVHAAVRVGTAGANEHVVRTADEHRVRAQVDRFRIGPFRRVVRVHAAAIVHHRVVTAEHDVQITLGVDRDRGPGMVVDAGPERVRLRPLAGGAIERANAIGVAPPPRPIGVLPDDMRFSVVRDDVVARSGRGPFAADFGNELRLGGGELRGQREDDEQKSQGGHRWVRG